MNTRRNSWLRSPATNLACGYYAVEILHMHTMNIQQAIRHGGQLLAESSPSATLDARVLLACVLQCSNTHLLAWPEKELSKVQQSNFEKLVDQRQQGVPVAYLTGTREFWSLGFIVDDSTLIPRPETETLVEYILEKFRKNDNLSLLDMGTGTGAIAIAIASERPGWEIAASDISRQALTLARRNSDRHRTHNISFIESNWFENIKQNDFDIIVSNPPYIAENDPHLHQGDVRFEPQTALTSGKTGMDDIEQICLQAHNFLNSNGTLVIEHGYDQKQQVADCFAENGFAAIEQVRDLSGHTRMTAGRKL